MAKGKHQEFIESLSPKDLKQYRKLEKKLLVAIPFQFLSLVIAVFCLLHPAKDIFDALRAAKLPTADGVITSPAKMVEAKPLFGFEMETVVAEYEFEYQGRLHRGTNVFVFGKQPDRQLAKVVASRLKEDTAVTVRIDKDNLEKSGVEIAWLQPFFSAYLAVGFLSITLGSNPVIKIIKTMNTFQVRPHS
ncbi:MAG: DUF3592 domain-containing protein [Armatimonadetes bacterium]|nr:DUF3592 domain-containing protein [Armatimonadota bacterium]